MDCFRPRIEKGRILIIANMLELACEHGIGSSSFELLWQ
jgi:hypothetical protein